jgi:hypothetical protein
MQTSTPWFLCMKAHVRSGGTAVRGDTNFIATSQFRCCNMCKVQLQYNYASYISGFQTGQYVPIVQNDGGHFEKLM